MIEREVTADTAAEAMDRALGKQVATGEVVSIKVTVVPPTP